MSQGLQESPVAQDTPIGNQIDPDHGKKEKRRGSRYWVEGAGEAARLGKMIDPWAYWGSFGISLRKPGPVAFDTLRQIAHSCEPISAIINTRQNQVAAFAQKGPKGDDRKPGWRVEKKEGETTEDDLKRIKEVEYFFEHQHVKVPDEITKRLKRGLDFPETDFEGFLRMVVRDRLTLDAVAGEKTRTPAGKLFSVWNLDAARIWRAFRKEVREDGPNITAALEAATWMQERGPTPDSFDEIDYVQEYRGREYTGWPAKDFIYGFANPRTNMESYGYGYSELEMMVSIVTAILNAIAYNKAQFTNGSLPPGFLTLYGDWDEEQVEGFKREMEMRLQGPSNQQRLGILWSSSQGDGKAGNRAAEWISMRGMNREMEYHQWLDWLLNIACALYQIAPEEIGIKSWGGGGESAPMFDKGPMAQLKHSKDKGLKPLLTWIAGIINKEIISEFYDDLVFKFINIEPEDEGVRTDLMTKRVSAGYETVNMARQKNGEPKIEETWADAPANPELMQVWSQEHEQQQQQAQMGQEAPEDQAQGASRFMFEPPEQGGAGEGGGAPQGEKGMQGGQEDGAAGGAGPGNPLVKSRVYVPQRELIRLRKKLWVPAGRGPGAKAAIHPEVASVSRFFDEGA